MIDFEVIKKFNLPLSIKVCLKVTKEGYFFAEFPDFPGCNTEATNFSELVKNVTDVVLTYFDVPRTEAEKFNILYYPPGVLTKKDEPIDKLIHAQENKHEYRNTAVLFNYFTSLNHGLNSSLRG